jgi:hypothetical protein
MNRLVLDTKVVVSAVLVPSASPRGYALRFAAVTVIGSGWLPSSNQTLPMPGTLAQAIWSPAFSYPRTM